MSAWDAAALVAGLGGAVCSLLVSAWLRELSGDVDEVSNDLADLEDRVSLLERRRDGN